MEKNIAKEITIVLLPLLFYNFELINENTIFLDLREIFNLNLLSMNQNWKENPSTFISKITTSEFSEKIVSLINSKEKEFTFTKIVLINYPLNKIQLENLEKNLEIVGLSISKLIVTNLPSFDVLANAKNENFLCPICFKSYSRSAFIRENKYLCPLDEKSFSVSYVNRFTEHLTTYYLQNSIEVIQNFVNNEQKKRRILSFNIDLKSALMEDIRKNLLNIIEKNNA